MRLSTFVSSEKTKRLQRMQDAVRKGSFHIQDWQVYRIGDKRLTIWEVRSTHTHRSPRVYLVSKVTMEDLFEWKCTCPDFEANGKWIPCKHILYIQECF